VTQRVRERGKGVKNGPISVTSLMDDPIPGDGVYIMCKVRILKQEK